MSVSSEKTKTKWEGKKYMGLSGAKLQAMIGVAGGAGFLLFGYDQGVMGSLLTLPSFTQRFPEIDTTTTGDPAITGVSTQANVQGAVIGIYEIGCMLGALSSLWLGDRLGRRKMIYFGCFWMIIGAILQTTSFGVVQLAIARVVTGVGNGMNTSTIPAYLAECAPAHLRGKLIMIEGALITGGIMISYWIDFAFYWLDQPNIPERYRSVSWRMPIALQILLCIPTAVITWKLPESPRWLLLKGRTEEARLAMSALEETPEDDHVLALKIKEIEESIALTKDVKLADIFTNGPGRNFHRATLGFVSQMFQQISGINLITYYAGTIFQNNLGFSPLLARIIAAANGTEYFAASWIAVFLVERSGRRPLMLFGALGQSICMAILAITNSDTVQKPIVLNPGTPEATLKGQNQGASVVAAVMLFAFNSCFAVGWLGMTWLTPAEIAPLSVRAASNGISTASNWIFNFLIVLVTPIGFATIRYNTYTVFAVINFAIFIATFFVFPETKGRSLEEMDDIFARSSKWNPYDVVRVEKATPHRYKNGKLIGKIGRDEESIGDGNETVAEVEPEEKKKHQVNNTATANGSDSEHSSHR